MKSIANLLTNIAPIFQALSAPARIEILMTIGQGEACVCHLESRLGYRQAYISQHLMALRQVGLLDSRRDGKFIFYRLAIPGILELLQKAAQIVGGNLPELGSFRLEKQCACPICVPRIPNLAPLEHAY